MAALAAAPGSRLASTLAAGFRPMTQPPPGLASSGPRLRRGLRWYLIGRAASGVLGLVWLALLVHTLPPQQLGSYFALWSLFELAQLASGLGVVAYLNRFLAVDAQRESQRRFAAILLALLAWRLATLAVAAVTLTAAWPVLAEALGLAVVFPGPTLLLSLLAAEGIVRWCESAADSLLLQALRQSLALLRNLLRIGALTAATGLGASVDAAWVLRAEAACATFVAVCGLVMLGLWTWHRGRAAPDARASTAATAESGHLTLRARLRFAVQGHLALVLGLPAGMDGFRLLVGGAAGVEALAIFGTAASLADMVARHTPALLLLDFVRSVLTARSTGGNAEAEALFWPRLLIRVNAVALAALCALALVLADAALRQVGAHAPEGTAALLFALLLLQFVQSLRVAAGLVAHLRTDNRPVLAATLTTLLAPAVVVAAAPSLGAWAGVVGLWSLEAIYAATLLGGLRLHPARLLGEARLWQSVACAGIGAGVAAALVEVLLLTLGLAGAADLLAAGIGIAIYGGLLWWQAPLAPDEVAALMRLWRPRPRRS